jgi:uncharacterized protein YxjI
MEDLLNNAAYTLQLAQKLTVMKNQWTLTKIDNNPTELGVIAQKRMSLKENVTCTTPDGSAVLFQISGRNVLELKGRYDVTDGSGATIGTISKAFGASLGRSTYMIETGSGHWTLTETSHVQAILRRILGVLTDIPWFMRVQFSLLDETGSHVGHVNRSNRGIKDTYEIRVEDPRLDQRMAAAVGVAADAFMNR